MTKFACPCCLQLTLDERGGYDICPVCFWEDDGDWDDLNDDVMRGGPNHGLTIIEGRANFAKYGACEPSMAIHTRAPLLEERPKQMPTDLSGFAWSGSHFKSGIPTRQRLKGRKDRDEAKVKRAVRAECVERDGHCLVLKLGLPGCKGRSTWAHLAGHRRSQTRGLPPTVRHDSRWTAMLCLRHHKQEEANTHRVVYHTVQYANGPVSWEQAA